MVGHFEMFAKIDFTGLPFSYYLLNSVPIFHSEQISCSNDHPQNRES